MGHEKTEFLRSIAKNHMPEKRLKSQSAMEYLMTYGWAILIVAIVLIALFQLGIFNGTRLEPHATAGACQIHKSIAGASLAGQCNNQWPQFVAQFGGVNSNIAIGPSSGLVAGNEATFVVWLDLLGNGNQAPRAIIFGQYATYLDVCYLSHSMFSIDTVIGNQQTVTGGNCAPTNQWIQYAGSYNGVATTLYVNGVPMASSSLNSGNIISGQVMIGQCSCGSFNFNGLISNVQLYNVSLSQGEIYGLYQEGIGGAPIDPSHTVGWWPLNGNAQDYSGSNNEGVPTSIAYNSTWSSGYVQP